MMTMMNVEFVLKFFKPHFKSNKNKKQ